MSVIDLVILTFLYYAHYPNRLLWVTSRAGLTCPQLALALTSRYPLGNYDRDDCAPALAPAGRTCGSQLRFAGFSFLVQGNFLQLPNTFCINSVAGGVALTTEDIRADQTYWSREVAALLQIGDSTVRKWCRVLEAQGYRFIRDEQDRRAFTDHDAIAMRFFKELTQDKGVALEHVDRQEEFNQALLQELADQRRYIEDSLNRRDELLMRTLRESLDERKALAAAAAEQAADAQAQKWWKFGRGKK